jgi:hypothetical protein
VAEIARFEIRVLGKPPGYGYQSVESHDRSVSSTRMIRPVDFATSFDTSQAGTTVCVKHHPTGHSRTRFVEKAGNISRTRDALVAELQRLLFDDNDSGVDIASERPTKCDSGWSMTGTH